MKLIEELNYKVNIKDIGNCVKEIMQHPIVMKMEGISVQYRKGIPSPWDIVDGLNSLKVYNGASEKDFNQTHEKFIDTEVEKIVKDFKLCRTRILRKDCKTCYSFHRDPTWRLHVPIFTDKDCIFYWPEHKEQQHLEIGKVYLVNTKEKHTFINSSDRHRWHLVGCVDV